MSSMVFETLQSLSLKWPIALVLLIIPLALGLWLLRYTGARWGERIWLVAGLSSMVVGLARPTIQGFEPSPLDQVVLVIDCSASMRAADVAPSRIDVAKQIAKSFIDALPTSASVSLIGHAATASLLQAPTNQAKALEEALERISLQPGSALGSGIILAIAQAVPEAAVDVERLTGGSSRRSAQISAYPGRPSGGNDRDENRRDEPFAKPPTEIEVGSRENAVVVLLADGDSNIGPAPMEMAAVARLWGLRIYSIGIGTSAGAILRSDGISARVRLDDKLLREVASSTGAEYFGIEDQGAIKRIFESLSGRIGLKKRKHIEVTHWFALLGCLMVLCSAIMSVSRKGRIL